MANSQPASRIPVPSPSFAGGNVRGPQYLHIKRKRHEDPVDALFIHSPAPPAHTTTLSPPTDEGSKRRRVTEDFIWRRVGAGDGTSDRAGGVDRRLASRRERAKSVVGGMTAGTLVGSDGVPIVQTENNDFGKAGDGEATSRQTPAAQPRTFHLSRETLESAYRLPKNELRSGEFPSIAGKKRKGVAVLVEHKEHDGDVDMGGIKPWSPKRVKGTEDPNLQSMATEDHPRKRPGATAAEKRWREEQWGPTTARQDVTAPESGMTKSFAGQPQKQGEFNMELAKSLQGFALQELQHEKTVVESQPRKTQPASVSQLSLEQQQPELRLKVPPKSPARRPAQKNIAAPTVAPVPVPKMSSSREDSSVLDGEADDGDYVYDVYVRQPGTMMDVDGGNASAAEGLGKIGVLVLTEADQEDWELYAAEEDDSDKDWNSEDEDENAEDYYGNDYPDAPSDGSDEFEDVYRYRKDASDDEEWDEDDPAFSDDDDDVKFPWKKKERAWMARGGEDEDEDEEDGVKSVSEGLQ